MSNSHSDNALPGASSDRGVVKAITNFAGGLADHAGKRFKLLGLELREAGMHLGVLAGLAVLALFTLLLGYLFLAVSLMFFLADATGWSWAQVILLLAGIHLLAALVSGLIVWSRFKKPVLPATLQELKKDSEWLKNSKNSN